MANKDRHLQPSPVPPDIVLSGLPVTQAHFQDQTQLTGTNFFSGAQNTTMYNPMLYDIQTGINVLDVLAKYTTPGAELHSYSRHPPPRCHTGTRTTILQKGSEWLRDHHKQEKRLLWLHGPAGVGKSAISQTLAEGEATRGSLGATFFFSRSNNRKDPRHLFTTIAYQLAVADRSYKTYIEEALAADPKLLDQSMAQQFACLIIKPFSERRIHQGHSSLSIFLDALDECEGERVQCEILSLIVGFVLRSSPSLAWIITSRPEAHLKAFFSRSSIQPVFWEMDVPIDADESRQDVELYLRAEFNNIHESYVDVIPFELGEWPSGDEFMEVARAASGLFLLSSTITRFIDDPAFGDPISRLTYVISNTLKTPTSVSQGSETPSDVLDALYSDILSSIPRAALQSMKLILGYYLSHSLTSRRRTYSLVTVCNILGIQQHTAYQALRKLHSVLDVPQPKDAYTHKIRFLHSSFGEYLLDPKRAQDYSINISEIHTYLWRRYVRILTEATARDEENFIPAGDDHGLSDTDVILAWPDRESTRQQQNLLYELASMQWGNLLFNHYGSVECASCIAVGFSFSVLVEPKEILDFVESIDYRRLWRYIRPQTPHLLSWFYDRCPPLIEDKLVNRISLDDIDWSCVLDSSLAYRFEELAEEGSARTPTQWRERVLETNKDDPFSLAAMVLGSNPAKRCIVFQYDDYPTNWACAFDYSTKD